jgi:hypothetical protein
VLRIGPFPFSVTIGISRPLPQNLTIPVPAEHTIVLTVSLRTPSNGHLWLDLVIWSELAVAEEFTGVSPVTIPERRHYQ